MISFIIYLITGILSIIFLSMVFLFIFCEKFEIYMKHRVGDSQ